MTYSYTQISQYLRCPRSYRYRYLDGWQEKETRAAMAFGRCFERALAAYFLQPTIDFAHRYSSGMAGDASIVAPRSISKFTTSASAASLATIQARI